MAGKQFGQKDKRSGKQQQEGNLGQKEARREKDWGRADVLRGRLAELGITVEDTPGGPRWKRSAGT